MVQERGLAHTGLTGDDQRTGAAASGTAHQRFQFRQLVLSSPQGRNVRHQVRLRREYRFAISFDGAFYRSVDLIRRASRCRAR
ncbi:hypothetical protein H114_11816 [Streptomyces gancidicus BKS 13-15]|uniref:Uncharacterized protein n=1 Tax=Streptomyces gancidicus BKS 13-15 TaxID=1284664 RepID=M3E5E3_STREZ|nr:hypothetical protein H114_11816 [Streptomyces gancidicus BKS 13-15]